MLLQAIERKRYQMFETAKIYGMSSKQTLKCSQELDQLIHLQQSRNNRVNYQKIS
ncbi:aspartyl-phosphate phosphatase Spo0E family protein [Alkalihalobacillus sp. AL-G]|uniref:aspartyl-phosphate phosphatase Spo0E family protein n=1 Tax=Alkalihalobacillus sp. AL-G TaxID=2926399 RepID=UPI00272C03B9|nr:aspartyl-phosphate phosphatase Spo0E family protein [Alkalihalobacillus sp. AL-G]WLD94976.1 aspartyl-phosphate phosphatase Spo0E family protein [Alkalihalobacillus sp. AL-G]